MVGLIIFIVAISASLTWLMNGGFDYIKQKNKKS